MNTLDFLNTPRKRSELIAYAERVEERLMPIGAANYLAIAIRITAPDTACKIMVAALRDLSAGQPHVALLSYADEARNWTSLASLPERKCYLAAIFQTLCHKDQVAFWRYIQGRAAA